MTEPDLKAILDQCLHEMSTGGETIERCLQRYPQYAQQLAPLIQAADRIQKTRHPRLSVSASKAIEQRLLKRAAELRRSRAKPSPWPLPFSLRPLATVAATLIVVLALVLAGGGGIVYASTDSLPGSPLYGVKRATEQVQLSLTPAGTSRAELHIKFAQRRLEEVQALAEIRGQVDEEALAALAEATDLALEETEKAPAQDKSALLDKLVSLTERQQTVLERVLAEAPDAAQKGLNRALEASLRGHERAREALEKEKPGPDVKPIKAPKPVHAPGEHGQGQGPPSMPPGQSGEEHGPPAEPPGQSGEEHGPPAEPPGQSGEEHGPPAEPPGQSDKDHGPPAKPSSQSSEETLHPMALALAKFFTDALGLDYDETMGSHEDGMGFGDIAQACWMSYALEGEVKASEILAAKKSGDFSSIDSELLGGETPTDWSQFRETVLGNEKVQKNLGALMSGRAGDDGITLTANQGKDKKQGKGSSEEGVESSAEPPAKGKGKGSKGGGPPAEPPAKGKGQGSDENGEQSKGKGKGGMPTP
jgi:hypothetical protein